MLFSVGTENRTASAAILARVNSSSLPSLFSGHTASPDCAFQRQTALLHSLSTWFMSLFQYHTKTRSRGVPTKPYRHWVERKDYVITCSLFSGLYTQTKLLPPLPPFPTGDYWSPVQVKGSFNYGLYLINYSNACSWLFLLDYKTLLLSLLTCSQFSGYI